MASSRFGNKGYVQMDLAGGTDDTMTSGYQRRLEDETQAGSMFDTSLQRARGSQVLALRNLPPLSRGKDGPEPYSGRGAPLHNYFPFPLGMGISTQGIQEKLTPFLCAFTF